MGDLDVDQVRSVEVADGIRTAFVDGKKASSLEDYFGGVSVVAFTPDDLAVVKGGPEVRTAFFLAPSDRKGPYFNSGSSQDFARSLRG